MDSRIAEIYGNKVRLRICGLCWSGSSLLLVKHSGIREGGFFSPPGGGLEFGESIEMALKREFREETGLEIEVGRFRFGCELISPPLHAVELFFEVEHKGRLQAGADPELQIIQDAVFTSFEAIGEMRQENLHGIFKIAPTLEEFHRLQGFYRVE